MLTTQMFTEMVSLSMMSVALSLDAFSVSLGLGVIALSKRQIIKIGLVVGLFHVLMPFMGILMGKYIAEKFGAISAIAGSILLLFIGFQIFLSSFKEDDLLRFMPIGYGLILFAFSVSVDSFTVGLSLGMFGSRLILALIFFGAFSCMFSWMGFYIGRKSKITFGPWAGVLGGLILIIFAVKLLLNVKL